MKAAFLSHNGLGDHLYSIGAIRFLLKYYTSVEFLCKDTYLDNVKLFFSDLSNVQCIPFQSQDEFKDCQRIMNEKDTSYDFLICGCHRTYLTSRITNIHYLKAIQELKRNPEYTIDYDTLDSSNYSFIEGFYKDIGLDLSVFFSDWYLPKTKESTELYHLVQEYKIIFLQTTTQFQQKLSVDGIVQKYFMEENTILINNDDNVYKECQYSDNAILKRKYEICQHFVKNKIVYYLDTLLHSSEIYIIDSCFVGMILPLLKTHQLKANPIRIIIRSKVNEILL